MAAGDAYTYAYGQLHATGHGTTGTGGGGGSHASSGTVGQDVKNAGGTFGSPGPACSARGGSSSSR